MGKIIYQLPYPWSQERGQAKIMNGSVYKQYLSNSSENNQVTAIDTNKIV